MHLVYEAFQTTFLQSLIVSVISAAILRAFAPSSNVVWSSLHEFTFRIPQPENPPGQLLRTQSIVVHNLGRRRAVNVEVIFNYRPEHFEIWPQIRYETSTNPDGRFIVSFPTLGRREFVNVELLSSIDLPAVLNVRSDDAPSKSVQVTFNRKLPAWVLRGLQLLVILGAFSVVYLLIAGIKLL